MVERTVTGTVRTENEFTSNIIREGKGVSCCRNLQINEENSKYFSGILSHSSFSLNCFSYFSVDSFKLLTMEES